MVRIPELVLANKALLNVIKDATRRRFELFLPCDMPVPVKSI